MTRFRLRIAVAWRLFVGMLLNLAGILDVRQAFRSKAKRPQIVFQAYAEHLALFFAPVIERIQREAPHVEIHFIVLPHPEFSFASLVRLRRFARESLHLPADHIRFFWQALWRRYDLLICADVYAKFPLRRPRTVLLKHGAGVASRILKPNWLRKTIADFDLILVNGEADRDVLRRYGRDREVDEKVIAAGLPYLDRLHTCSETRDAYLSRIGIKPGRRVAFVGPSWRGLQAIQARRPEYFDQLIAVLNDLDWEVLIKMHVCSFNKAMVDGSDWAARVSRLTQPHVHVDLDIDDVPAFLHADILITDISSRAFDFMLLDKPVIAVVPEDLFTDELDVERIDLLRQGARLIQSPAELGAAISQGLIDDAGTRTTRQHIARRAFANPGRATEAVVGHLLQQLNTNTVA